MHADGLAYTIETGDIDRARRTYDGRTWRPAEAALIRSACARWGVDPAGFGVAPRPECPPHLWSLRATLTLPAVPAHPTESDFHLAAMEAASHAPAPEWTWRLEAIRWRVGHPETPLDLAAIQAATADTLALFARRAVS
jgi:hypothetical protein